ncbi:hypothetical protein QS257_06185 [Terrilactibacillus sp. S3-3]|nr:hypothetical protein QS257_06185 [Terrilactibacillus sp. S3-3]
MAELEAFKSYLQGVSEFWVDEYYERYHYVPDEERAVMARKKRLLKERHAEIEKTIVNARILNIVPELANRRIDYRLHYKWLIKQKDDFYVEELIEDRQLTVQEGRVLFDCLQKKRSGMTKAEGYRPLLRRRYGKTIFVFNMIGLKR